MKKPLEEQFFSNPETLKAIGFQLGILL